MSDWSSAKVKRRGRGTDRFGRPGLGYCPVFQSHCYGANRGNQKSLFVESIVKDVQLAVTIAQMHHSPFVAPNG